MEQAFVDRIVVVHGSRGVVLVRLVERDKEYIDLLVRQPFDTFPHIFRRHVVHCNQNLISGIGAMQIQRTIKAKRDRLIDEVNALQIERHKRIQFVHHDRAVREQLHVGLRSMGTPVCRLLKYGDVEHLQHALFKIGKRSRKFTGEARKNIRQELNPAPGIHGNQLAERLCQNAFGRLGKIVADACICTETGEGELAVDRTRVEVIVVDEILQGRGKAAVLCEGFDTRNQTGTVAEGAANIRQNDFGSLLFQLDIAALRQ